MFNIKTSLAIIILLVSFSTIMAQLSISEADTLFARGAYLSAKGAHKEALDTHQLCYAIREKILPPNSPDLAKSLQEIGFLLNETGARAESIAYFEKALAINVLCFGAQSIPVANTLTQMSEPHRYLYHYDLALGLLEKGLAIKQQLLPPYHIDFFTSYYDLGIWYSSLYRFTDAFHYFELALEINQKNGLSKEQKMAACYSEMGEIALLQKNTLKALEYFEQGKAVMEHCNLSEHPDYGYITNDLAQVHYALKNYDRSIEMYQQTVQLKRKAAKRDNSEIATVFVGLGRAQTAKGNFNVALEAFDTAQNIWNNIFGLDNAKIYQSESGMANTYLAMYRSSGHLEHLLQSRTHFQRAENLLDKMIRFEESVLKRKKWLNAANSIFEQAISVEMILSAQGDPSALEHAWQLSETMHGFDLFVTAQASNALAFSGLPKDTLEKEKKFRQDLIELEKQKMQLTADQGLPLNHVQVLEKNGLYLDKQNSYRQFLQGLEQDYPSYYHLKYAYDNITLEQTQYLLATDQTLLEYFIGDSAIYIFVVNKDKSRVVAVPCDFPLTEWVTKLRQGITSYHFTPAPPPGLYESSVREYAAAAHQLYQKLILPVAAWLHTEIVIVPDGILNYLPFETLLSNTPKDLTNFKIYPFLAHKNVFSYTYSATMLQQMTLKKHLREPSGGLLAFAPFFTDSSTQLSQPSDIAIGWRNAFLPLPFSGSEVLLAQKSMSEKSVVYLGNEATLERFKQEAGDYRVLHLATHGKANDQKGAASYLVFQSTTDSIRDGFLYVSDLYGLTLNADLVLLSACETSMGEFYQGEGVVSLARAFSYAGAKSVATSLWSVNDNATLILMDYFYQEIQKGQPKNKALAAAKRAYLKENPAHTGHPFFWASFILVGAIGY
jgi:CHAT domain-containing protein